MANVALVSIFCPDRTGLVAAITGYLFDRGGNLADTSFAVLGEAAEFSAVCEFPDGTAFESVEAELGRLPELDGAEIAVRPFRLSPVHGQAAEVTHHITVTGGDQPGLVARLCETFVQFRANIVSLNAGRSAGFPSYTIRFAVCIPAENGNACLATIANTAGNLQLSCHWETV
jgi:glycine cleavage system transcriptional repressor